MSLKLYLFGVPRVEWNGRPLDFNLRKALALLIYLAVTRQAHSRDTLATLLWPEKDQQTARANLRRTLYELGQLLDAPLFDVAADRVRLRPDAPIWVDTEEFWRRLPPEPAGGVLDADHLARGQDAASLYAGDFLAGFTLPDSPEYDDWQFFQREELRRAFVGLLDKMISTYQEQGNWPEGLRLARRLVALDVLEESSHRRLMQLYALAGQRSAALRQYEECARILRQELDAPPDGETTALFEAIRTRRILTHEAAAPVTAAAAPGEPAPAVPGSHPTHQPLPAQTTPFIGRRQELAEVLRRLSDPDCRLLTLVGPGGIGKTRLALEAALALKHAQPAQFADGIAFVPLQPVDAPNRIVTAIADGLGLEFYGTEPPQQQLLRYLRPKHLLLVLDNFEHLLEGAGLVSEILAGAPDIKLLITSREALKLQEEWFHPLAGMSLPPVLMVHPSGQMGGVTLQRPESAASDAVQLFVQTARRAQVAFDPDPQQTQIVRICRLVDGMPLAIELAASWLKLLSCSQIGDEVERGMDILVTRHHNVPARHRSMRVVLEQSWQLLDEQEQAVFRRLSVFRGGFSVEAATQVAGASLPLLALFVEKALVRAVSEGRYQLHELIRQFAAEQLRLVPDDYEQACARHSLYYLSLMRQQTARFKGRHHQEAFAEIVASLDDVRSAWNHASERRDVQALDAAAEGVWVFGDSRGVFRAVEAAFGQAYEALVNERAVAGLPVEQIALIGFLRAGQGYMCHRSGDLAQGRVYLEQGINLLRQVYPHARRKTAFALLYYGWASASRWELEQARQSSEESMALFAELGDRWGQAACIELLCATARNAGELAESKRLAQEGLALSTLIEAQKLRGGFLQKLGELAIWSGDYALAEQALNEAIEIGLTVGSLPGIAQIRRDLAHVSICLGDYAHAVQLLQECLSSLRDSGYELWMMRILPYLGSVYSLLGDHAQAELMYQRGIRAAEELNNRNGRALCLIGLGAIALKMGDSVRAEQVTREAVNLRQQLGQEPEFADACCHLGYILADFGESRAYEAWQMYQQVLHLTLKHEMAPLALKAFTGVARLLAARGEPARAADLLALAAHHPAATAETRQKAHELLATLGPVPSHSNLRPDWQQMAQALIEEMAV